MEPTCAVVAYGALAECLRARGVLDAWLARIDLQEQDFTTPEARLSLDATFHLWRVERGALHP